MSPCRACGAETPASARYCPACGALQDEDRSPGAPCERRTVTTLFCDLVGFTAMCEHADPEDVDTLLRSYHRTIRHAIEQFGGAVERLVGDGVLGSFGAAVLHEDDAERAVRSALRMQERVAGLKGPGDAPVQMRVGINTGETLVRLGVDPDRGESYLAGDAVNTASRLQSIAPPGGIVIGDLTRSLTSNVAECEAMGPVALKGKTRPETVWLVTGLVARPGVDLGRSFATPLVGREVELGVLQGLCKKVLASRSPQFALVTAEAGLGKTRLIHELARWLDERADVLAWWRQAQCPAFGNGLSVWPIAQVVRQHTGVAETEPQAVAEERLQAALERAPDREWLVERLRPLLGLPSPPAPKAENFSAWLRFLELLASAKPTVIVIEDLHWASPLMAEFARHVIATAGDVPLFGVFTARPEVLTAAAGPWAGPCDDAGDRVTRLDLHPLSASETQRLVATLAEDDTGPPIADIVHRCGGNPLYAEELVRLWRQEVGGQHRVGPGTGDAAGRQIPASLQALIAARLDSVAPGLKAVLADASVVGEVFSLDALRAVNDTGAALEDALGYLAARDFVRRLPSEYACASARYAFQHAVTQEVVYAQLPRAARLRRHEAFGRHLLGRGRDEDDLLGVRHMRAALSLALQVGDGDAVERLRAPLLDGLTRVAETMMALDLQESERLTRDALTLTTVGEPARARLLVLLGRCLHRAGRLREAEVVLEEAASAFAPGDTSSRATALVYLCDALLHLGEPRVVTVADDALSLLGPEPTPALVAALERRATLHLTEDQPEQARSCADAARLAARRLGMPEPPRAIEMSALAACLLGDVDAGMGEATRLLAVVSTPGAPGRMPSAFAILSELALLYQSAERAVELGIAGQRLADERHDFTGWVTCRMAELEDRFFLGHWQNLEAALHDLAKSLASNDDLFGLADVQDFRLALSSLTGVELNGDLNRSVLEMSRELHGNLGLSYLVLALHAHAGGRSGDALAMLDLMDRHTVNFSSIPSLMLWWTLAVRLAHDLGEPCTSARLAERVLATPAAPDPAKAAARAALAEARDDDTAAALYAEAATAWKEHGIPFEYGHALLRRACLLARRGRTAEASPLRTEAIAVFRRLGAVPSLVAAEGHLDGTSAARRPLRRQSDRGGPG